MHHYRKTRNSYKSHNALDLKKDVCTFCDDANLPRVIGENDTMYLMPNRVFYDMFEGRRVVDHLLIVPKRHVETLGEFTDQEKIDQMSLAGQYEAKGYNVYARGVGSITRSVKYQHTHLIKLVNKKPNAMLYINKPYVLIDV